MSTVDDIEDVFSDDATRARTALAYAQALEARVEELEAEVRKLRTLIEQG